MPLSGYLWRVPERKATCLSTWAPCFFHALPHIYTFRDFFQMWHSIVCCWARSCFQRAQFHAEAYDILLNEQHDLTTFEGVVELMRMVLGHLSHVYC